MLADTHGASRRRQQPRIRAAPDVDRARALLDEAGVATPIDAGTIHYAEASRRCPTYAAADRRRTSTRVGLRMRQPRARARARTSSSSRTARNARSRSRLAGWEADYPDGGTYFEPLLTSRHGPAAARTTATSRTRRSIAEIARVRGDAAGPGTAHGRVRRSLSYRTVGGAGAVAQPLHTSPRDRTSPPSGTAATTTAPTGRPPRWALRTSPTDGGRTAVRVAGR